MPHEVQAARVRQADVADEEIERGAGERFGIPGIALSGYGMEDDINQSLDAGFLDHIVKPINLESLKAAIRRAVSPEGAGAPR